MTAALDNIKVGVINVAVGECKIELSTIFMNMPTSPDWLKNMVAEYDGDPYKRLVEIGRIAIKEDHKGILYIRVNLTQEKD